MNIILSFKVALFPFLATWGQKNATKWWETLTPDILSLQKGIMANVLAYSCLNLVMFSFLLQVFLKLDLLQIKLTETIPLPDTNFC